MDIFKILDQLEDFIEKGSRVPFSGKVMLNEDRLFDFVDQIRGSIPYEIKQAQQIIIDKEKFIADSKDEASKMMEDARRELERRAEESEIVQQARIYAEELVLREQNAAQQLKEEAAVYASNVLSELEETLHNLINEVQNGKQELAQDIGSSDRFLDKSSNK
ncbi:MAG: ATPase [Clostridia bacterium]|nr:ATPase [Clostridia bacterium]